MQIDWDWIKQRPHFLAEELSEKYDVLVIYRYLWRRSHLVSNKTFVKKVPLPCFPFSRFKLMFKINKLIEKLFIHLILKLYRPEIIWVTSPTIYPFNETENGKYKIIYDCMDDAQAFRYSESQRRHVIKSEEVLLKLSQVVLVTSKELGRQITSRNCEPNKIVHVPNAFGGNIATLSKNCTNGICHVPYRICYVGTISFWIDFDSILYCLEKRKDIEFHFIGPADLMIPPSHSRLIFHGPMEHSQLLKATQNYDCMIIPFKNEDLIKSVDPIKIYEYINYSKNIISYYYDELTKFSDFVHFYTNMEELLYAIDNLRKENKLKYSQDQRRIFLEHNSWKIRAKAITQAIDLPPKSGAVNNCF